MPTAAVPLKPISSTLAVMTAKAAIIGTILLLLLIRYNIHNQGMTAVRTDDSLLTDGRRAAGRRVSGNRLTVVKWQIVWALLPTM